MNLLFHGDALDLAARLDPGSVALAYLDPPFAVGVAFGARTRPMERRALSAPDSGPVAYDDRWPSLAAYIAWLAPRLEAVYAALHARATLWLHLDHRAVHHAKVLCDDLFGAPRFVGEIIWVPGNGSKARKGPGMTHQTILVYARGEEFVWNGRDPSLREDFARTSLSMHFKNVDDDGRRFRERVVAGKAYRYYADEGRALGSVWTDCPAMVSNTPLRKETTGYPTQKPLKLLDRIVRASTMPGDRVVDPFCGSGTTLVAAAALGRVFAGGDVGALSIDVTGRRLAAAGVAFSTSASAPTSQPRPA